MGQRIVTWGWHSRWPAPAKLNLFLHVVGRRTDGYHLLETVFRFINRGDFLQFAARADDRVVLVDGLPGVAPEDNLVVRAVQLLREATGCRHGVDIRLEKYLPMGGGLGGGSSDAATVLLALNHLWQLGLPRQRLQEIGLALGADVPVFVYGRNAFARGVGEELTPLDLPPAWYVVVEPPVQVPTPLIFGADDLCRSTPSLAFDAWWPGVGHNDLEPVACRLFPAVTACRDALAALAPTLMTGSGACVFATFATPDDAAIALAALPPELRAWQAAGLPAHPLAALDAQAAVRAGIV
jgi:4-diphosphocytidyl-2-C-methyl-D-erythritol kinase